MSKTPQTIALAVLLFVPAAAHAQESLGGWRGLKVSALDTIYVTDDSAGRPRANCCGSKPGVYGCRPASRSFQFMIALNPSV